MAGVELLDIVKRFKNETVLEGVTLTVAEGETLVLFGPSGAGKSSFVQAGVIPRGPARRFFCA